MLTLRACTICADACMQGYKDWSKYALDASSRDGAVKLSKYENLVSYYQPDGTAVARIDGHLMLFTANEGDYKEEPQRPRFLAAADPQAFSAEAWAVMQDRAVRTA